VSPKDLSQQARARFRYLLMIFLNFDSGIACRQSVFPTGARLNTVGCDFGLLIDGIACRQKRLVPTGAHDLGFPVVDDFF
jgi:hypothetical protein